MKNTLSTLKAAVGITALVLAGATAANAARLNPVADKTTASECSACHMLYAPGLLPKASWGKILDTLGDHFGEDASLDNKTTKHIRNYLMSHANTRITTSAAKPTLRITKFAWFNRIHGSRARAYATSHKSVGSISNCAGCHRGAEKGYFGDD